jgi:hypothetical protein
MITYEKQTKTNTVVYFLINSVLKNKIKKIIILKNKGSNKKNISGRWVSISSQ